MTYKDENTALLKTILNASFFKPWKHPEKYYNSIERRDLAVELYVTAACNQKCEYCYLYKHGGDLYPANIRNRGKILKNLELLIEYMIDQRYFINRFDIFSGEIMHTPFGLAVLEKIYQGKTKGLSVREIHIPSNCSFLLDEKAAQALQNMMDKLRTVGVTVLFSASVDGPLIEDEARPFTDDRKGVRDQAFYDKIFSFVKKNGGGFHPMISAFAVEKWKENFAWWAEQCKKYGFFLPDNVMMLEVRNDEWADEKIKAYQSFLEYYGEWMLNECCNGSTETFAEYILGIESDLPIRGYFNLSLLADSQIATCSISHQLTVRLGDLAICPCHRTAYPEFLYGKFVVEDGKITDIEANNPFVAAKVLMMNQRVCHHGCDTCWNKNFCVRQCFGAQYESGQEIFMPAKSVCGLLMAKTKTLYRIYEKYGVKKQAHRFLSGERKLGWGAENRIKIFLEQFSELEKVLGCGNDH